MSDPTAAELAHPQWRPGTPHYEVWYLTLHHQGRAWWFRYTLHDSGHGGEAALWAITYEDPERDLSLRDVYPLTSFQDARPTPGSFRITLGPGELDLHHARGEVGEGERRVTWDLEFESASGRFSHVPSLLYSIRLAGSRLANPALALQVRGTITVNSTRHELKGAVGELGHLFGRQHAQRWTWAHAHGLGDQPDATFEGVSAQVGRGGFLLPPATPLCLQTNTHDLRWNRARTLWSPKSDFELGVWTFEARQPNLRLRGRVSAPPEAFVCVEYADPKGETMYCHHAEHADLTLELDERRSGRWELTQRWQCPGTTAFEYAAPNPDPRPHRRLNLSEGRPSN